MSLCTEKFLDIQTKLIRGREQEITSAYNPSAREVVAGGLLQVGGQPSLYREFGASQDFIVGPYKKRRRKKGKNLPEESLLILMAKK